MTKLSKWSIGCVTALLCLAGSATFNATPVAAQSGFTELVPSGPTMPPVAPGGSAWTAGAKLATAFLSWLSDQGLKSAINAKLTEMKPQIDSAMPSSGGVLVVIGIQQSDQPDANGNYFRSVLDGYIGGPGATPQATMKTYLAQGRLEQGVPKGFVRRNVYFWKSAGAK
jgi:hypothetical protein